MKKGAAGCFSLEKLLRNPESENQESAGLDLGLPGASLRLAQCLYGAKLVPEQCRHGESTMLARCKYGAFREDTAKENKKRREPGG